MHIDSETSAFLTAVLLTIMGCAWILWLMPSCNEPECAKAHQKHRVAERSKAIAKTHETFHSPDRPQPLCSLCQGRKRDEP